MNDPSFAVLQKVLDGERTFAITPRIPGGFISPKDLIKIAEVAEKYRGQLKITSGQRITILRLKPEDVENAWKDLGMEPGVRGTYTVKNVEICPAAFCKRSMRRCARSCASFCRRCRRSVCSCARACAAALRVRAD